MKFIRFEFISPCVFCVFSSRCHPFRSSDSTTHRIQSFSSVPGQMIKMVVKMKRPSQVESIHTKRTANVKADKGFGHKTDDDPNYFIICRRRMGNRSTYAQHKDPPRMQSVSELVHWYTYNIAFTQNLILLLSTAAPCSRPQQQSRGENGLIKTAPRRSCKKVLDSIAFLWIGSLGLSRSKL